jgi:protein-disulfide isomerase
MFASMVVLVAAGVVISALVQRGQPASTPDSAGYRGPFAPVTLNADNSVTMAGPRVSGPVLDVYEDFQCSACRVFERTYGPTIERLAYLGKVKVVYHPFTSFSPQPQQARNAGITSASFMTCVRSQRYAALNAPVSDEIMNSGLSNLPVLKLNGHVVSPGATPAALRRMIASASAGGQPVTAAANASSKRA